MTEPPGVRWPATDASRPNAARVYDYFLGSKDNFAADREEAARIEAVFGTPRPGHLTVPREMALRNRMFLDRAVSWASRQGIRQFLDLGAGYPAGGRVIRLPGSEEVTHEVTLRSVHEAALDGGPARVVYVDHDPLVFTHTAALAADGVNVVAVQGDLSDPRGILGGVAVLPYDPVPQGFIDFREPACVILGLVLQLWPAEQARHIAAAYVKALAPGSALVISVPRHEDAGLCERAGANFTAARFWNHMRGQVEGFFTGTRLMDPGVVPARGWNGGWQDYQRPDSSAYVLAGVGVKR